MEQEQAHNAPLQSPSTIAFCRVGINIFNRASHRQRQQKLLALGREGVKYGPFFSSRRLLSLGW